MVNLTKEWLLRLGLFLTSVLISLLIAEAMLRAFYPISDGRDNVTLDGRPITELFVPGSVYRQVSAEYDALTTITDKGHRIPGVEGSPEIVFIGDSFTYGWGLKDEETFASIYCSRLGRACANLGKPSTGTKQQLDRLQEFFDKWSWKPKEVKLFFFGMSSSFSAGNDFVDNYYHGRWLKSQAASKKQEIEKKETAAKLVEYEPGLIERAINYRVVLQQNSYLIRFLKFHLGAWLRSTAVADPGQERMSEALAYTKESLERLDNMSRKYGFTYNIYLLVPVQDVIRRTFGDTFDTLNGISPKRPIPTAQLFIDAPQSYYFSYDGHLNPKGSRKIAEFLDSQDSGK